jgi:hypothetical protein
MKNPASSIPRRYTTTKTETCDTVVRMDFFCLFYLFVSPHNIGAKPRDKEDELRKIMQTEVPDDGVRFDSYAVLCQRILPNY